MPAGFAKESVRTMHVSSEDRDPRHRSLTDDLGAIATQVDAYAVPPAATVELPAPPEQLCLPIESTGPVRVGEVRIGAEIIARVPSGVSVPLGCEGTATIVVISATTPPVDGSPTVVDLSACSYPVPETSDVPTARLTEPLGCTGMKVNARRLAPGQWVPEHTEGTQEELFVPMAGSAAMRIAGERYRTPPGTIVRVAPEIPRSAGTDGTEASLWVMIGAPPTGAPDEWDPDATVLD